MTSATDNLMVMPASVAVRQGDEGRNYSPVLPDIWPVGRPEDGLERGRPHLYRDLRWCASCERLTTFNPVERFPFGWIGDCLRCGNAMYVMDERTSGEEE